jgi:hypothetical protein
MNTERAPQTPSIYRKPAVERLGTLREITRQHLLAEGNDGWFICGDDGEVTEAGGQRNS